MDGADHRSRPVIEACHDPTAMTQVFDDREPVAASHGLSAVRRTGPVDMGPVDTGLGDVKAPDLENRIVDRLIADKQIADKPITDKFDPSHPNASCPSARGVVVSEPTPADRRVLI